VILGISLALLVLCVVALCSHYREWSAKQRERRASCPHHRRRKVFAYGDPRFPKEVCDECGAQRDLRAPITCRHCGGDINLNPPDREGWS